MNNLSSISVTILAKNAQKTLQECLEALKDFDEVILLDNESSDDTQSIAQSFPNVRIYTSAFIGFGALKNLAVSYAKNDWILSIDSDEILEESTKQALTTMTLQTNTIYALPRKNLYNGEWIKACGWYPDYVWRLFNKNFTRFNDNVVHESVIIPQNAQTLKLQSGIKHYAASNIESIIAKMDRYTTYSAQQKYKQGKKTSMFGAIARFFVTFAKDYLVRGGFKYGYKGFIVALLNANGAFFRYAKLYELHKQTKERE
ncbi:glycosyltransferase family 2 protein [Helicobacter sp. MIT 05-5293]|uniref:glycosyltransferase family 2 protein n=1 Tax=Helicobacter sp. MIT 05-5293 TaxID=1548149 RepID=UPI00051DF0F7|nr:glycosyltransferase family 2 protein [Helicobacter sp. MIT 05-5293]TLD80202.1 glycosyltransferase family 2 protein [Helicobacter sp. MIT 05-5293]